MPYKEPKIEKIYYRIGEVAKMLGVNPSNIRFWEKEFNNIKPRKNGKGNRLYTSEDIEQIKLIFHLVKERGMTLKGAKEKIRNNPSETTGNIEIIQHLQNIRQQLLEIRNHLNQG